MAIDQENCAIRRHEVRPSPFEQASGSVTGVQYRPGEQTDVSSMDVHHDALLGVGDVDIRRGDVHRGGRPARVMSSLRPYSGGPERDSPTSQR